MDSRRAPWHGKTLAAEEAARRRLCETQPGSFSSSWQSPASTAGESGFFERRKHAEPGWRSPTIPTAELRRLLYQRQARKAPPAPCAAPPVLDPPISQSALCSPQPSTLFLAGTRSKRRHQLSSVFSYAQNKPETLPHQSKGENLLTFGSTDSAAKREKCTATTFFPSCSDVFPSRPLSSFASCDRPPARAARPSPPRRTPAREEAPRKIPYFVPASPPVKGGQFSSCDRRCASIEHFDIDQTTRLRKFFKQPS